MRLKPPNGHVDASESSNQDQTASVSRVSSSWATWQNLNSSSSIQLTRFKRNDLHIYILSELLIKHQMPIRRLRLNLLVN